MVTTLERYFLDRDGVRIPFVGTLAEAKDKARMLADGWRAGVAIIHPNGRLITVVQAQGDG